MARTGPICPTDDSDSGTTNRASLVDPCNPCNVLPRRGTARALVDPCDPCNPPLLERSSLGSTAVEGCEETEPPTSTAAPETSDPADPTKKPRVRGREQEVQGTAAAVPTGSDAGVGSGPDGTVSPVGWGLVGAGSVLLLAVAGAYGGRRRGSHQA